MSVLSKINKKICFSVKVLTTTTEMVINSKVQKMTFLMKFKSLFAKSFYILQTTLDQFEQKQKCIQFRKSILKIDFIISLKQKTLTRSSASFDRKLTKHFKEFN